MSSNAVEGAASSKRRTNKFCVPKMNTVQEDIEDMSDSDRWKLKNEDTEEQIGWCS